MTARKLGGTVARALKSARRPRKKVNKHGCPAVFPVCSKKPHKRNEPSQYKWNSQKVEDLAREQAYFARWESFVAKFWQIHS